MFTKSSLIDIAVGIALVAVAVFVVDVAHAGLSNRVPWYGIYAQWKGQVLSPLYITLAVGAVVIEKYVTIAPWMRRFRGQPQR